MMVSTLASVVIADHGRPVTGEREDYDALLDLPHGPSRDDLPNERVLVWQEGALAHIILDLALSDRDGMGALAEPKPTFAQAGDEILDDHGHPRCMDAYPHAVLVYKLQPPRSAVDPCRHLEADRCIESNTAVIVDGDHELPFRNLLGIAQPSLELEHLRRLVSDQVHEDLLGFFLSVSPFACGHV